MTFKIPEGKKIIHVIDANNWINRAYFATPVLHTLDGIPTNGIKGFVNMLNKLINKIRNEQKTEPHVAVCFDIARHKVFRAKLFNDWYKRDHDLLDQLMPAKADSSKKYKGSRSQDQHTKEDLIAQIAICQDIVRASGLLMLHGDDLKQPVEADDLIGTVCKTVPKCLKVIYSRDKDMAQLIDRQTRIIQQAQSNSDEVYVTPKNCQEIFGVPPELVIEKLMLEGDSVDNIPGVPGWGPGATKELLLEHGSLKAVARAAKGIEKGRYKKAARTVAGLKHEPTAADKKRGITKPYVLPRPDFEVTRQLATIRTNVKGVPRKYSDYKMKEPDIKQLKKIKQTLEFNNLLWV